MKKKILIKEKEGDDIIVSFLEVEGDPEDFLRRNGYTDFSWTYIQFGEKKRIKKW